MVGKRTSSNNRSTNDNNNQAPAPNYRNAMKELGGAKKKSTQTSKSHKNYPKCPFKRANVSDCRIKVYPAFFWIQFSVYEVWARVCTWCCCFFRSVLWLLSFVSVRVRVCVCAFVFFYFVLFCFARFNLIAAHISIQNNKTSLKLNRSVEDIHSIGGFI